MTEHNIVEWVKLDNNIKLLNQNTKHLREKRKSLERKIIDDIDNKIIKINDETIKSVKSKHTQPLTLAYIESCLSKLIDNDNNVDYIMDYIKQNRPYKCEIELKRK